MRNIHLHIKTGNLNVQNSRVNFIAPDVKTLRKDFASNVPTTAKQPGVIEDNIKLMKSTNSDVSYKICIDGKKNKQWLWERTR